jgi:hypothetical protein
MSRFVSLAIALASTTLLLPATAASAQGGGYYNATPVTAPAKPNVITNGMMWKCGDTACTAAKGSARDTIVCELVVKRVGQLSTFTANGAAFDADALAKCNSRAK